MPSRAGTRGIPRRHRPRGSRRRGKWCRRPTWSKSGQLARLPEVYLLLKGEDLPWLYLARPRRRSRRSELEIPSPLHRHPCLGICVRQVENRMMWQGRTTLCKAYRGGWLRAAPVDDPVRWIEGPTKYWKDRGKGRWSGHGVLGSVLEDFKTRHRRHIPQSSTAAVRTAEDRAEMPSAIAEGRGP